MCGIFGVSNGSPVASHLLRGLRALEYRGYDSAGMAAAVDGRIERRRSPGKLHNLEKLLQSRPLNGRTGIAHTRWATHGVPNGDNAHPHASERVAVVHNGIIENYRTLRGELAAAGSRFASDTDSEVIPHLVQHHLDRDDDPLRAIHRSLERLEGTYALGIVVGGHGERMYAARRGSPLALGVGRRVSYIASDALAMDDGVDHVIYLEDGDVAVLEQDEIAIFDAAGVQVSRPTRRRSRVAVDRGKGGYRHYMLKEIHEQPDAVRRTLDGMLDADGRLAPSPVPFERLRRLTAVACGTSLYAASVARYWFESLAGMPLDVEIASELRYRDLVLQEDEGALFISQSGETADTLAALRRVRECGRPTVSVVNVPESSIARESDAVVPTRAGPEIGVASTKAFTAQLAVLATLAVQAGVARGRLDAQAAERWLTRLRRVPQMLSAALERQADCARLATRIANARDLLYLGRGINFPLALEAALKLKEISYIHADGYAAGEMKHGPIALIDGEVPVVMIAPSDPLFDKSVSNLREVTARSAPLLLLSDGPGVELLGEEVTDAVAMPEGDLVSNPFIYAVAVQLIAYHTALLRGTDVDQPRNLAKSVTVE